MAAFERRAVRPAWSGTAQCIEVGQARVRAEVRQLRATLASYGGHLRHGAAWQAWQEMWLRRPWLWLLFARDGWRVIDRWSVLRPLTQPRFAQQYRRLLRHAGDEVLVFCHVGRFVELYGPQRVAGQAVLRLVRVWRPRAGFGYTIGFPARRAATYEQRALAAGIAVVHVVPCHDPDGFAPADRRGQRRQPRQVSRVVVPGG